MFSRSAPADLDILWEMTNFAGSHQRMARPSLPAQTRSVDLSFSRREQLADPRTRGNDSEEILTTIAKVLWRQMWGAHVGEYLRKMFVEYKAIQYPRFPGPGSNWVAEAAVGTHPGHSRVPGAETFGWSAEMSSWVGAARAGGFHFAVCTSHSGRNYPFARQHNLEMQHWDMEQYTPTLVMDGRTILRQQPVVEVCRK